jgi:oligogalacturonide lyase
VTRRHFAFALAAGVPWSKPRPHLIAPERVRYLDPSTEFPVVRLTSPEHTSFLPAPYQRAVSRKSSFLLFSNDRTGSPQLYQMLLASGEARQLSEASDLDASSATLTADDRSVFFFDGPSLRQLSISKLSDREVYRVRDGWRRGTGFSLAPGGAAAVLVETDGARWQLRRIALTSRPAEPVTVVEAGEAIADPLVRPGREDILYRQGPAALMLASPGRAPRALPLAPGGLGPAYWASAGDSVVYLNLPAVPGQLNALRECAPETGADGLVATTSQFAVFAPNPDASVFAGASRNKAAPYVLLLLRATRHELSVCEHRSSNPARVAPVFSPDSQNIYFGSDRHGKPAIYSVAMDRLVEETES